MDIKPSNKALVRDLGFRILEGEFGKGTERKELLGKYYEEAQEVANLLIMAYEYPYREKAIIKARKETFERDAVLWKLGFDPERQVQMLSEEDLRDYNDYLWEMSEGC